MNDDLYDEFIRADAVCPMCNRNIALDPYDRRFMHHPSPELGIDCPGGRLAPGPSGRTGGAR